MSFTHELLTPVCLEAVTRPDGRFYTTPDGVFPSVTTVLGGPAGDYLEDDPSWKEKWIEKVGIEEAEAVSRRATTRGNLVHDLAERHLMNEEVPVHELSWTLRADYLRLTNVLRDVDEVYGTELGLYSKWLGTAGRTDLLCEWKGIRTVLDFKTSLRPKVAFGIPKYFVQGACYAKMANEMYPGLNIRQVVIIIMVDHDAPLVYAEQVDKWLPDVRRVYRGERT